MLAYIFQMALVVFRQNAVRCQQSIKQSQLGLEMHLYECCILPCLGKPIFESQDMTVRDLVAMLVERKFGYV